MIVWALDWTIDIGTSWRRYVGQKIDSIVFFARGTPALQQSRVQEEHRQPGLVGQSTTRKSTTRNRSRTEGS